MQAQFIDHGDVLFHDDLWLYGSGTAGELNHALGTTFERTTCQIFQIFMPIAHGAQQHRQIHTGDQFGTLAEHQALRHIGGRGAHDIGQHQGLQ